MKCPECHNSLLEIKAGDILVDVCHSGCGGVWFDERELKKFDEPHEFEAQAIFQAAKGKPHQKTTDALRHCPKCEGEAGLCRRWYDIKNQVEVDQCLYCSGIWLDLGELETIRSQYKTEQERLKAADEYVDHALDGTIAELQAENQRKLSELQTQTINRRTYLRGTAGTTLERADAGLLLFKLALRGLLSQ